VRLVDVKEVPALDESIQELRFDHASKLFAFQTDLILARGCYLLRLRALNSALHGSIWKEGWPLVGKLHDFNRADL